ncbi:major histocompatibility complex class I-related gene protein-like isoform X1 [Sceloporus undulatus]|uniref:major histocompatibility complex class I-related gene protein-like isoform X1 n=1 Tax=Sceloporus undulatus TaxID=8520 RepID=UPI001C4D8C36|nr:major histocompatibility complex class I-related gene protein-like isoform X1 [Sceloporus undulatus]XP_042308836.1 major histocompatibility complex class I-related gene protein-like isoform X1 [Sceloporus undulatus]XP_042308837.1 major histocompatibility complex class I-related gene protein-like isoform X1 [Sceloporus undulatus]
MGRLLCLLGVTALFLIGASGDALPPGPSPQAANGGSSHVLRYYATSVLEPGQQVPHFASVGYVNDQQIVYYDIETKRRRPKNDWITKSVEHDPQYWEWTTQRVQNAEQWFRAVLVNVPKYFNQTGGLHTWQEMVCCELRKDGSKGGYWQYAYDGEDYISLDKETLTWTAASLPAQNTKRKWDPNTAFNQFTKNYLEEECIEWLRRYLEYGKKALLRTDPPKVKVTRKADYDNMETLICRVDGFYPKDIDIAWTKDGEVWMEDTFSGLVSPNSDGTYYTWLSIKIDPKDRERYKCRVEHDGLPEHVDLAWEEPVSNQRSNSSGRGSTAPI